MIVGGAALDQAAICLKAGCRWVGSSCATPETGLASRINICHTLNEKPTGGEKTVRNGEPTAGGGVGRETLPLCTKFSDTVEGEWSSSSSKNPMWEPHKCRLTWFSPHETASCLSGKKISFFGDSLLHSVFGWLQEQLVLAGAGKTVVVASKSFHIAGGKQQFAYKNAKGGGSLFEFWWAPSVYHQRPLGGHGGLIPPGEYKKRDVVLLGMAAWDMGTYYQGIDRYYTELTAIVKAMVAAQEAQRAGGVKPRVIVNALHKAWPDRCLDPNSPCNKCNSPAKEELMRKAGIQGAHCGYQQAQQGDKGKGGGAAEPYSILSSFAFTNTPYARNDPVTDSAGVKKPDALHYGKNTTMMEAQFLLNMICGAGGEEGGGLLKGPEMDTTAGGGCGPQSYDQELRELEQANLKGGSEVETCVDPKWKPKHGRRLMRRQP